MSKEEKVEATENTESEVVESSVAPGNEVSADATPVHEVPAPMVTEAQSTGFKAAFNRHKTAYVAMISVLATLLIIFGGVAIMAGFSGGHHGGRSSNASSSASSTRGSESNSSSNSSERSGRSDSTGSTSRDSNRSGRSDSGSERSGRSTGSSNDSSRSGRSGSGSSSNEGKSRSNMTDAEKQELRQQKDAQRSNAQTETNESVDTEDTTASE